MRRIIYLCAYLFLESCTIKMHPSLKNICQEQKGNNFYLKTGILEIDEPIICGNDINIIGNNTIIKCKNGFSQPYIKIINSKKCSLSKIAFVEPNLRNTDNKAHLEKMNILYGVEVFNSTGINISQCNFENFNHTIIKILDSEYVKLDNCVFKNCGLSTYKDIEYSYDAVFLGGYNKIANIEIENCKFENIGNTFTSGYLPWPNDGDGIQILTNGIAENIVINNCEFYDCSARGIKVQSGKNIRLTKNKFNNCGFAIAFPMNSDIEEVIVENNNIGKCNYAFGTDALGAIRKNIYKLAIKNNTIDSCEYFIRTSGLSYLLDSEISNNSVNKLSTYFAVGRFVNSSIINNKVSSFSYVKDPSFNMALYISPESANLDIKNNIFNSSDKNSRLIVNTSKNQVILENNVINVLCY